MHVYIMCIFIYVLLIFSLSIWHTPCIIQSIGPQTVEFIVTKLSGGREVKNMAGKNIFFPNIIKLVSNDLVSILYFWHICAKSIILTLKWDTITWYPLEKNAKAMGKQSL